METKEVQLKFIESTKNHRETYQDAELQEMMSSIRQSGLLQPIGIVEKSKNKYQIIFGHRRFLACKKLKFDTISCIVFPSGSNPDELVANNFIENIHRKNPGMLEYGMAFDRMIKTENYTPPEIAKLINKSAEFVRAALQTFNDIPKEYSRKVVYMDNPHERKPGTISVSISKAIVNAQKSCLITKEEGRKLFEKAEKGASMSEIKTILKSKRGDAELKIINISFTFIKEEIKEFNDMELRAKIKEIVFKHLKLSDPKTEIKQREMF